MKKYIAVLFLSLVITTTSFASGGDGSPSPRDPNDSGKKDGPVITAGGSEAGPKAMGRSQYIGRDGNNRKLPA